MCVAAALVRRWRGWPQTIDAEVRASIGEVGVWWGVTAIVGAVLGIAGFAPGARDLFRLDVRGALLAYLPAVALGVLVGMLEARGKLTADGFARLALVDSALGQFFTWCLVALSELPGAAVMVAFPTMLAGYHGYALRSAPEQPFIAIATVVALAGAVLVNPSASHLPLYGVGGALAIGGCLVLGRISLLQHHATRRSVALREAVDAQVLNERHRQLEDVASALLEMHGTTHDAGNALSGLVVSLERLAVLARRRPLDERVSTSIETAANHLSTSLEQLQGLLRQARTAGRSASVGYEVVDLEPALRKVALEVGARFGHVAIALEPLDPSCRRVHVSGGEVTFCRMLVNLLGNACEGDGRRGAANVWVRASPIEDGAQVAIEVRDDGPGLPSAHLDNPFVTFRTTKANGTGIGLYTTRQLALASGGVVSIDNGERGGAVATLRLPRAEA